MKELKKLAILLRALGFKVEVENETISFGDGAVYDNIFAAVDLANCHWDIWHEGDLFEVHFYNGSEYIYDQVYFSFQFDVIKQIFIDYDKYGK
jgi:hypothetical protein